MGIAWQTSRVVCLLLVFCVNSFGQSRARQGRILVLAFFKEHHRKKSPEPEPVVKWLGSCLPRYFGLVDMTGLAPRDCQATTQSPQKEFFSGRMWMNLSGSRRGVHRG